MAMLIEQSSGADDTLSRPRAFGIIATIVACFLWSASSPAYGPEGHRIVAEIAQAHLTPATAAQIQTLLAHDLDKSGNPSGRTSIAEVASWADEIKGTPVGDQDKPWHYDDVPVCGPVNHDTYCPSGNCASTQIDHFVGVLKDPNAAERDRNEALKWIVHLIGDIHQPLHAATRGDGGGNSVKVSLSGIGTTSSHPTLHGIWDTELVAQTISDNGGEPSFVGAAISDCDQQVWLRGSVSDWITESHNLARDIVYANLPGGFVCQAPDTQTVPLGVDYYTAAKPVLEVQLRKAGIRLAKVLNDALGAPGAGTPPVPVSGTPPSPVGGTPPSPPVTTITDPNAPAPLLDTGHPVQWWFVFKFNTASFPGCGDSGPQTQCLFGGTVKPYPQGHGQQFVYASSESPSLQKGSGCVGATTTDPLGATFNQIYNGNFHYVVWNDQLKGAPNIPGCGTNCNSPWGHSKGMVAWDDAGNGLVLQVSTPSWPGAGSSAHPRADDGNTLGCVIDDNVEVSQHFFALSLTEPDLRRVLLALQNASVGTDPTNPQLVNNGGPAEIQALVKTLGKKSTSVNVTQELLSSNVQLISKPSLLHVPPWQMVSSLLNGIPLRAATWWANPYIPTTDANTAVGCWDAQLSKPGAVEIATSGHWGSQTFGLKGLGSPNFNHAKIGISTAPDAAVSIFGDMNQQGSLSGPNCGSSQNGRGGLFYVVTDPTLAASIKSLIAGDTSPVGAQ
jgi:hypothetical protein